MSATVTSSNTVDIKMDCANDKTFTMKIDNPRTDLTWNEINSVMDKTCYSDDPGFIQIYDKEGNSFAVLNSATKTNVTTSKELIE